MMPPIDHLILARTHQDMLVRHSKCWEPNEACAILCGQKNHIVDYCHLTDNADESPIRFSIPSKDLIAAYTKADKIGCQVVGIFHSHPGSLAFPSDTDKRFMQINPVPWVIYSPVNSKFRAFVMYKNAIKEIPLENDI